jgi:hypothetical protein
MVTGAGKAPEWRGHGKGWTLTALSLPVSPFSHPIIKIKVQIRE